MGNVRGFETDDDTAAIIGKLASPRALTTSLVVNAERSKGEL